MSPSIFFKRNLKKVDPFRFTNVYIYIGPRWDQKRPALLRSHPVPDFKKENKMDYLGVFEDDNSYSTETKKKKQS